MSSLCFSALFFHFCYPFRRGVEAELEIVFSIRGDLGQYTGIRLYIVIKNALSSFQNKSQCLIDFFLTSTELWIDVFMDI